MQELVKARARRKRLLAKVEAEAEKDRVLAEAEKAEVLAKLWLESIELKAEEELISCSEYDSSIAT